MRAKIERILGVLGLLCVLGLLGFCAQRSPWEVYDADTHRAVGTTPADGTFSARHVQFMICPMPFETAWDFVKNTA